MASGHDTIKAEAVANTEARDQTGGSTGDRLVNAGRIRAVFDATGGQAVGTVAIGPTLPDNAYITAAWYTVITTFTSAADTATISLGIATDDAAGLTAAIAINDGTSPWDAGHFDCIQDGTAANFSEQTTSATRTLEAVVAVQDLTAGKLIVWADYVIGE